MDLLRPPEPSRYDINFRLFRTPIRVPPGFWLVQLAIAVAIAIRGDLLSSGLWVPAAFVSILIHEFGHIAAGRRFGAPGEIVLTFFGGLAVGSSNLFARWRRILVYLAGPLAQFSFAVLLFVGLEIYDESLTLHELNYPSRGQQLLEETWVILMAMNTFWPALNLLIPIEPLDGGQIIREWADWRVGRNNPAPWEQDPDWWKRR